jgi:hypothetical protein
MALTRRRSEVPDPSAWRAPRASTPWIFAGAALAGCVVVGLIGSHSPLLPKCPFKEVTGLDCPGCGLTRGVRELVTGHPLAALDHNVLLVALVPFVTWAWLAWAGLITRRPPPSVGGRRAWALLAFLVAFAVVRNLPFPVCRWLSSAGPGD